MVDQSHDHDPCWRIHEEVRNHHVDPLVREVAVLHGHLGHDRVRQVVDQSHDRDPCWRIHEEVRNRHVDRLVRQVAAQNRDHGLGWRNHVAVRNLRAALLVVRQGGAVVALFVHPGHDQVHRVAVQSLGHDRFCHCHVVVRNRPVVLLAAHQVGEVADHLVGLVRDRDQQAEVPRQGQDPVAQVYLHDRRVYVQGDVLRHGGLSRVVLHRQDVEQTGLRFAGLDSGWRVR